MAECAKGIYHPRRPRETTFYHLVEQHCERFEQVYPERYEDRCGFLRSIFRETVYKYLDCGDLKQGFAWVRCRECGRENLPRYLIRALLRNKFDDTRFRMTAGGVAVGSLDRRRGMKFL